MVRVSVIVFKLGEREMPHTMIEPIKAYLTHLQDDICFRFSEMDGKSSFLRDNWNKDDIMLSGHGVSCVLEKGAVFEKAGVNFSHVCGKILPPSARECRMKHNEKSFQALGVSLVIHPDNPYIPTSHANVRFFLLESPDDEPVWWFGGGYDLTPYYGFKEDCEYWHKTAKKACDPFGDGVYAELKAWCDDYFYLKHRAEPRGIGGLFFDDWNRWDLSRCFEFMQSIGSSYADAYLPIVEKRKSHRFGEREKAFQKIRRGRYAEFNMIYDRGTLFGLQSGGRTESILMSLPPEVSWAYDYHPEEGTQEAKLLTDFLVPRDWVS